MSKHMWHIEQMIPPLLRPLVDESAHDMVHIEARGFDFESVEWKIYFKYMYAVSDRGEELGVRISDMGDLELYGDRFSMSLGYGDALKAYQWYLAEEALLR